MIVWDIVFSCIFLSTCVVRLVAVDFTFALLVVRSEFAEIPLFAEVMGLKFASLLSACCVLLIISAHVIFRLSSRKNNGGCCLGAGAQQTAHRCVRIGPHNLIADPYSRPYNELVLISDSWNY